MQPEPKIQRGTAALQCGRWSSPGATYFITGNLDRPLTGLANPVVAAVVQAQFHALASAGHWHGRTFVLMPDHFHAVVTLGPTTDLSAALRLFNPEKAVETRRTRRAQRRKSFCVQREGVTRQVSRSRASFPLGLLRVLRALRVSTAVFRFKGPLTPPLRSRALRWQKNFYDHRLRVTEELLPTFLSIFLNPYRANLLATEEKWPWYFCSAADWEWFGGLTNESVPFPEWLC